MINTKYIATLALFFLCLWVPKAQASHSMGGEITYECMGGCTLRLHFRLYRDCGGTTSFSSMVNFAGSPGSCTVPTPLTAWTTWQITEITPVAPGTPTRCTTPGAAINGIQEYYAYRDYDYCSSTCTSLNVTWSSCCRSATITSLSSPSASGIAIDETVIQFPGSACNSSPQFSHHPVIYLCSATSPSSFYQNAIDPDGDSLVYSLTNCWSSPGTPISYAPGYSATQPLGPNWNVNLNSSTGVITFTPNPGGIQVAVLCVKVEEYRNGVLIGSIFRDMQVSVINCPCVNADPTFNPVSNLAGGSLSGNTIYAGIGDTLCMQLNSVDADTNFFQEIWSLDTLNGSYLSYLNGTIADTVFAATATEQTAAQWCWPSPVAGTYSVSFIVNETSCSPNQIHRDTLTLTIVVTDGDTVWPGDANDDLIANNVDILTVGLGFASTGSIRPGATNLWVGQYAPFWGDTLPNGLDKIHPDCDGNGVISFADTVAISNNYGLTHSKNGLGGSPVVAGSGTPVTLRFPQDSAYVGDTITIDILLGDTSMLATGVYGIAYTVNYDNSLTDSASVKVDFDSSWFADPTSSLHLAKDFYSSERIEIGQSRIDHTVANGLGRIGGITLVLTDNIDGKRNEIKAKTYHATISDVTLIDADGGRISVDPGVDSMVVYEIITERITNQPSPEPRMEVFPNPSQQFITISTSGCTLSEMEIRDVQGRVVMRPAVQGARFRLPIRNLTPGVYFIRATSDKKSFTQKILVL